MKSNVALLIFVVAAFSGGMLKDVANANFHVLEEKESHELAMFAIARCTASVQLVAAMFKENDRWKFRTLDWPAQEGQHFMDVLPLIGQAILNFIPNAPKKQKVAFAMEKGSVLDLPMELGRITVGLGWDIDEGEVDLDVSAVLMDHNGCDLEAVFFGRIESEEHGITHTGDNLTGEGDGDDEQIQVILERIGQNVHQVFFVVNIYTPQKNFQQVAKPYCRVIDDATGAEMCRYALRDAGTENGLIVSKIVREAGGRWSFHALGLPCRGRTYKDSLPQVRQMFHMKTQSLLLRSNSSGEISGDPSTPMCTTPMGAWEESAPLVGPPPPATSVCCALQ